MTKKLNLLALMDWLRSQQQVQKQMNVKNQKNSERKYRKIRGGLRFIHQQANIKLIIMRYRNIKQKMHIANSKFSICKVAWLIIRLIINSTILASIFLEPGFTDQLCGPLAMPAASKLMGRVLIIELTYFIWPFLFTFSLYLRPRSDKWRKLIQLKWPKMLFILMLKMIIILSQTQRLKYYMHVFFIELTILVFTGVFDIIGQQSVAEGWEIIMTDSFQRIAIFYEVTRTFCPNIAIYWFFVNLLLLSMSQIEAHVFYGSVAKYEQMEPVYPLALYVKQDIYRIMIMTFVYFGLFSFLQTSTLGYGMFGCFCVCILPLIYSIRKIQQSKYVLSLLSLIIACIIIAIFLNFRFRNPTLFRTFALQNHQMCGLFDRQ